MNIQEIKSLTDDQLRVKLAEALGWKSVCFENPNGSPKTGPCGAPPNAKDGCLENFAFLPNWPADLNACHEAEKALHPEIAAPMGSAWDRYCEALKVVVDGNQHRKHVHASARQRSEALLATLTKGEK